MEETPETTADPAAEHPADTPAQNAPEELDQQTAADSCYTIQFRPGEQFYSAVSRIPNLKFHEIVMVQTDHGLEPAAIHARTRPCPERTEPEQLGTFLIVRRGTREEVEKFDRLIEREEEAFRVCQQFIAKHALPMKLIRVERFMNGSKIIFFFTAETRVDFRELVKDLVQEFRTRVEIRQVGVRHETKMIGGLGCCGRELCCSSYIKNFAPVSIKMAKEQGLPLNPAKISGICNRLLCCLTYEYDTYHSLRKKMPKPGKTITVGEKTYKVIKVNPLEETIEANCLDDQEKNVLLKKEEWRQARPLPSPGQGPAQPQVGEAGGKKKKSRNPKPPEGGDEE
ncbi:PSP1 domain-containing protein [Thiovibrio sp. JS02]